MTTSANILFASDFSDFARRLIARRLNEHAIADRIARKTRKRAMWLGVLYQPESWRQIDPDPALICEYTDLPGEYYALAVWGGDRAKIMEWVD